MLKRKRKENKARLIAESASMVRPGPAVSWCDSVPSGSWPASMVCRWPAP